MPQNVCACACASERVFCVWKCMNLSWKFACCKLTNKFFRVPTSEWLMQVFGLSKFHFCNIFFLWWVLCFSLVFIFSSGARSLSLSFSLWSFGASRIILSNIPIKYHNYYCCCRCGCCCCECLLICYVMVKYAKRHRYEFIIVRALSFRLQSNYLLQARLLLLLLMFFFGFLCLAKVWLKKFLVTWLLCT